jgi:hypothetical protein
VADQPRHLRRIPDVGGAVGIVIDGDLAWVAGSNGVQVFDVRDGAAPDRLQTFVLPSSGPFLAVAGQRLITGGSRVGLSAWTVQHSAAWPTPRPTVPPSTPTQPTASPTVSPTPTQSAASPTTSPSATPTKRPSGLNPTATARAAVPLRRLYLPIVLWQTRAEDWPRWPVSH